MADVLTPAQRHKCMSAVRRENTAPEKLIRSILHKAGLRYRLHDKNLPGSPDLVFPRFHAVLFVHGCYWHRHGCYKSTVPKLHRDVWEEKFAANIERDAGNVRLLRDSGWRVMILWECALKGKTSYPEDKITSVIKEWLKSSGTFTQIPKAVNSQSPVVSGILSDIDVLAATGLQVDVQQHQAGGNQRHKAIVAQQIGHSNGNAGTHATAKRP